MDFDITIVPGDITVESVSGKTSPDACFLYLNTLEKYAAVLCPEDNTVVLYCDDRTRRGGDLTGEGTNFTQVSLPDGWAVQASRGRYSVRIIGVKLPGELEYELPVTVQIEEE